MMYDNYYQKVEKAAKLKRFVERHKIIFSIIISAILLFIAFYLGSKGTVSSFEIDTNSVTYGNTFVYKSNAMFSNVSYEYQLLNTNEWTTGYPSEAGTYNVRATSKSIFGYRHSQSKTVVIEKKSLTIDVATSSLTYGDTPKIQSTGLLETDTISLVDLAFNYEDLSKTQTNVCVNLDTLKILNKESKDVTNSYELTNNTSEISFNKKEVSLTLIGTSANKVYDSNKFDITTDLFKVDDSLAFLDTYTIDSVEIYDEKNNVVENAIKPGKYTYKVKSVSFKNGDINVNNNYYVKNKDIYGSFEILKRNITVSTLSQEKTYDSTDLFDSTVNLSDSSENTLVEGDTLNVLASSITKIKYAGNTKNKLTVNVINSSNEDVSDCYNITYAYGTLTVNKKDITVSTASDTKTYDGEPLTKKELTVDPLCDKETYKINEDKDTAITHVGETTNTYTISIYDGNTYNKQLNDSYNITYEYGTLIVNKRDIEVSTENAESTYNNSKYIYDLDFTVKNIVDGDSLKFNTYYTLNDSTVDPVDANTYQIHISTEYSVLSGDANENDYNIINKVSTLTINKKSLSLEIEDTQSYVFNGTKQVFNETRTLDLNDTNETIKYILISNKEITTIDEEAEVRLVGFNVYDKTRDTTKNYDVSLANSSIFKITKLDYKVIPSLSSDTSSVYSGNSVKYKNLLKFDVSGSLVINDKDYETEIISDNGYNEIRYVDTYSINITLKTISGFSLDNFNIDSTSFSLGYTVTKFDYKINPNNPTDEFDGEKHQYKKSIEDTNTTADTIKYELISDEITEVGTTNIRYQNLSVLNKDNKDVSANYNFSIINDTYIITKLKYEFSVDFGENSNYSTYDGNEVDITKLLNFTPSGKFEIQNNDYSISYLDSIGNTNPVKYVSGYTITITLNSISNWKLDNFDIVQTEFELQYEVIQADLKLQIITNNNNPYVYSGQIISPSYTYKVLEGKIYNESTLSFDFNYKLNDLNDTFTDPKNVGTYSYSLIDYTETEQGTDLSYKNYNISLSDDSKFEIEPYKYEIKFENQSFVFNGEEQKFVNSYYEVLNTSETLNYTLSSDEAIKTVKESSKISLSSYYVIDSDNRITTENYIITFGSNYKFTITPLSYSVNVDLTQNTSVYSGSVVDYLELLKFTTPGTLQIQSGDFSATVTSKGNNYNQIKYVSEYTITVIINTIAGFELDNYSNVQTKFELTYTVTKFKYIIDAKSPINVFDGEEHKYENTIEETLETGDTINYTLSSEKITEVGTKTITFKINFVDDSNKVDVKFNYDFDITNDTYTIIPLDYKVTPSLEQTTSVYNGETVDYISKLNFDVHGGKFEIQSGNYSITIVNSYGSVNEIKYVSSYNLTLTIKSIGNWGLINFNIEQTEFKLKYTITPANLELSITTIYNPTTDTGYTYTGSVITPNYKYSVTSGTVFNDATFNLNFNYLLNGIETTPIDVGTYYYSLDSYTEIDSANNFIGYKNYNITITNEPYFEIVPLKLTVKFNPKSETATYTGSIIDANKDYVITNGNNVPSNCYLTLTPILDDTLLHAKEYKYTSVSYTEIRGGKPVEDFKNYDITVEESIFEIKPLEVEVLMNGDEVTYNRENYTYNPNNISVNNKLQNDEFTFKVYYVAKDGNKLDNIKDSGTYTIYANITNYTLNSNVSEITDYNITNIPYTTIVINKKSIEVSIENLDTIYGKDYDPVIKTNDENYSVTADISYENRSYTSCKAKPSDYGNYTMSVDTNSVKLSYGNDEIGIDEFEKNYSLTYKVGTLSISQAIITLKGDRKTETYSGNSDVERTYTASFTNQVTNETVTITYTTYLKDLNDNIIDTNSILHAGTYKEIAYIESNHITITNSKYENFLFKTVENEFVVNPIILNLDSNMNFNKVYDGKDLEISPKDILVSNNGDLLSGDTITINLEGATDSSSTITIGSKADKYILSLYPYVTSSTSENGDYVINDKLNVEISKKKIDVETKTFSKTYDGIELTENDIKLNEFTLAENQSSKIDLTNIKGYINVGEYKNYSSIQIFDSSNNDVTSNYDINYTYGTITIVAREITIETDSANKVYDSKALQCLTYKLTGELARNDSIKIDKTKSTSLTKVGKIDNKLSIAIVNGDNDVTDNYNITYEYGSLEITKLTIYVKYELPNSYEYGTTLDLSEHVKAYYDETCNKNLKIDSIDYESFTFVYTNLNGEESTVYNSKHLSGGNYILNKTFNILNMSELVNDCYNINFVIQNDKFEVTKKSITVYTYGLNKFYTGNDIQLLQANLLDSTLADGDTLVVDEEKNKDVKISKDIKNGSIQNKLVVDIFNGNVDVTENYDIKYIYNNLNVHTKIDEAFDLTYDSDSSKDYVYSGTSPLKNNTTYSEAKTIELLSYVTVSLKINSADCYLDKDYSVLATNTIDAGIYYVKPSYSNLSITINGVPLTDDEIKDSISLDKINAYFEITKRTIFVTGTNFSYPYDGKVHYLDSASYKIINHENLTGDENYKLVDGDELRLEFDNYGEEDFIGTKNANITNVTAYSADGRVINNYNIYYTYDMVKDVYGSNSNITSYSSKFKFTITAKKIAITVVSDSASKVYDGTPLSAPSTCELKDKNVLIDGHRFVALEEVYSVVKPGKYDNQVKFRIVDSKGKDVTDYYSVKYTGKLTITKAKLIIETASASKTYDGTPLSASSICNLTNPEVLFTGHTFVPLYVGYEVTNAGSYENQVSFKILDSTGEDVTDLYDVKYTGKLKIEKLSVTITTGSANFAYDGKEHSCHMFTTSSLPTGYTVTISDKAYKNTITERGTIENKIDKGYVIIKDEKGKNVTNNFKITVNTGTLTVS